MSKVDPADRKALLQQALAAVDQMRARLATEQRARNEPIAIIGMACRYPGGVEDPEALWRLLDGAVDAVADTPADRWDRDAYFDPTPGTPGKMITRKGGFLAQVDRFEPEFFGIAPREAATLDPQQRLLLETAWEALERAGQAPDGLVGSETGVFVGITTSDYARIVGLDRADQSDVYAATGNALNAAAGRIAFVLGLQGPCVAVDTACSSSLVAIHLACQSLRAGESRLALAGGVNVVLRPEAAILFSRWGMLAPDGRCKTFDAAADGFVRSEGCGMLALKRLSDALADGNPVLAVIRGSASNQDGHSSGLTVPNGPAQQAVIRRALANAGVEPAAVHYVEAHGTGTPLGDPIEVEALAAELGKGRPAQDPLIIGAIKTNIGHTEAASGVAGVIKVVLALRHGRIPQHLHFRTPNPRIDWARIPVQVAAAPVDWPAAARPRIAGVSAFGFSGTNAHVVIEEAPVPPAPAPDLDRGHHLLVLSGRSDAALHDLAGRFAAHLAGHPEQALEDVCFTAAAGRAHLSHRLAIVASTREGLEADLRRAAAGDRRAGVVGERHSTNPTKVVWLFTGQGSQYAGLARRLYDTQPVFRAALDRCGELLRPHVDRPLTTVLFPDDGAASPIDDTGWTQPALFAVEYALATLWRGWGVEPTAVLGHSVGEYVAAAVAGALSLDDAIGLIAARGRLMQALPSDGAMAAVFAAEPDVAEAVRPRADRVSIAAVNGPREIVISGERGAVDEILAAFERRGVRSKALVVSHAFHSPLMEPMLDDFDRIARAITYHALRVPLVSNVTGEFVGSGTRLDAAYWRHHVRAPVRFFDSIQAVRAKGISTFLEIGPAPILSGLVRQGLGDSDVSVLASLRKGRDDWATMLAAVGGLFVAGVPVDWRAVDGSGSRRLVVLPTAAFQRRRHWVEAPAPSRIEPTRGERPGAHPLLGSRIDLAGLDGRLVWESQLSPSKLPYLLDHRVQDVPVFPATAYLEMAIAAMTEVAGDGPIGIRDISYHRPMFLRADRSRVVQFVLTPADLERWTFEVFSRETDASAWSRHASGKVYRLPDAMAQDRSHADLGPARERCDETISGRQFYASLVARGNTWGPAFQGLSEVRRRDGEAVSEVRVPDSLRADLDRYFAHPAVSDACGHVLTATIPLARSREARGGAFVGGGIDEVRVYGKTRTTRLHAYARLRDDASADGNILVGDVEVYDETGGLLAETIGARLFYFDGAEALAVPSNVRDWLFEVDWRPAPRGRPSPARVAAAGPWVVLCDAGGAGEAVAAALAARGETVVWVRPGPRLAFGDAHRAELPVGSAQAVSTFFTQLAARGEPLRGVVDLLSLDQPAVERATAQELDETRARPCTAILHVVQALGRLGATPRLWLVTRGAQRLASDSRCEVAQAAIWGFGRALSAERAALWGGLVDLDPLEAPVSAAERLCDELLNPDAEDQNRLPRGDSVRRAPGTVRRGRDLRAPGALARRRHLSDYGWVWRPRPRGGAVDGRPRSAAPHPDGTPRRAGTRGLG